MYCKINVKVGYAFSHVLPWHADLLYRTFGFRHVAAWPKRLLCLQDFFAGQHLVLHGPGGRWSADRYVAFVAARPQALGSQNYILKYYKYYNDLRCDRCAIACISRLVVLSNHEVAYWGMFFTYCNSYRRSVATSRPGCVVINIFLIIYYCYHYAHLWM